MNKQEEHIEAMKKDILELCDSIGAILHYDSMIELDINLDDYKSQNEDY